MKRIGLLLLLVSTPAAANVVSWDYIVAIDPVRGKADIELTVTGTNGRLGLCDDMRHTRKSLSRVVEIVGGKEERPLALDADDEDCFASLAPVKEGIPRRFHYRVDLGDLAERTGDPDWASRFGESYVVSDMALLMRPEPKTETATVTVGFRLPKDIEIATPWEELPHDADQEAALTKAYDEYVHGRFEAALEIAKNNVLRRYRYDLAQQDAGAYIAIGKLRTLGVLPIHGGTATVTLVDNPHQPSDAALLSWVKSALTITADFYGALPGGKVHLVLAPVRGESTPGVFGTILHRGLPSVVLMFGANASDLSFPGEWMAVHELFHLGNPLMTKRGSSWFVEGFATYYQDVLRARARLRDRVVMWSDLHEDFAAHCDPIDGRSLDEESQHIGERHTYQRVYSGGACLAFRLDVAIRQHSEGKASLDTVLAEMYQSKRVYSESEIIAALDAAAGTPLASEHLKSTRPIPWSALEKSLGIQPKSKDAVELKDDAPLSALRKSIF